MTRHYHGTTATAEQATGTRDKTYDLVSVLYHALQGGETCLPYMQDAEQAEDQELVQFLQEVQDCQRHLANRAKELLMSRLSRGKSQESHRGTARAGTYGHAMRNDSETPMMPEQADREGAEYLEMTGASTQGRSPRPRR